MKDVSSGTENTNLHPQEDVLTATCKDCKGELVIGLGMESGNMVALCNKCCRSVAIAVTLLGLRKARRAEMQADASLKIHLPWYASGCQDGPAESG